MDQQVLMPELNEIKGELKAINTKIDSTNERCDNQTFFFIAAITRIPSAPITGKTANTEAGRFPDGEYHETEAAP